MTSRIKRHFTDQIDNVIESITDKLNINFLKNQILKNAYGNTHTPIARLDPRVLMIWYTFFAIVPWLVHDVVFLLGAFILVTITTILAQVAGLVIFLFVLGVLGQTGYLLILSLIFGGDASVLIPLLVLSLKVSTVSLASITVFSGMEPDKLSSGLMWFGAPDQFSFSVSYAYRILPILMEEFQNILLSFRLRGLAPSTKGLRGKISYLIYMIKIIINSFYPLMLNTAKRSRTTVEALELKGYSYASKNKEVKKMKLASLKISYDDIIFIIISIIWILASILLSSYIRNGGL